MSDREDRCDDKWGAGGVSDSAGGGVIRAGKGEGRGTRGRSDGEGGDGDGDGEGGSGEELVARGLGGVNSEPFISRRRGWRDDRKSLRRPWTCATWRHVF